MSYIFNNQIAYSDSVNLDAFGRLRVSETRSLLELKYDQDKLPNQVDELVNGSASSTLDSTNACVIMSVSNTGGYVIRQSKERAIYQPGKSQLCDFSFSDFQLDSNVIKRVGYFSSTTAATYDSQFDGFFLESNGVNNKISFQMWKTGTLILSAATDTWDSSEVNPSTIDWSKTHLMAVDFQWLGVGRVRFGMNLSGNTYVFKTNSGTNNLDDVYMSSPDQPIRYEIRSSGGTGSFHQICSAISDEGTRNILKRTGSVSQINTVTLSTSGTKYPFIGLRASPIYDQVTIQLTNTQILNTSNDDFLVTVEINPTISSGMTYSSGNTAEWQYSLGNGAQTVTSDGVIIAGFIGQAGTSALTTIELNETEIKPGRKIDGTVDQLWVCITPLGAAATFIGSTNFTYEK
jgi:hypothetical protein